MPNPRRHLIFLLSILFSSVSPLLADKVDSLQARHDTILVRYFFFTTDSLNMDILHRELTSVLDNFQRYDPLSRSGFSATPGNVGLANHSIIYQPAVYNGFSFGLNSFDKYKYTIRNTRYYLHDRPVSYLSYFSGPKKEQLFRALLSHKILKTVTIAADFSVINSPGTYYRQKSDDKELLLTAQYYTKNKRFGAIANYRFNKFVVMENGGLLNDSIFENKLESDPALLDVNLVAAQNLVKESGAFANAYFFLSKAPAADSTGARPRTFHAGRIAYSFNYLNQSYLYSEDDPLVDYYQPYDIVIDSTQTHDSTHIRFYENSFSWSNLRLGEDFGNKYLYINFGLKHQYALLTGYADKRTFIQLVPNADLRIHLFRVLTLSGHGHYVIGDFNNNGYLLTANGLIDVTFKKGIKGVLDAEFGLASQEPGYFYSFYQSNHFRWDQPLQQQKFRWLSASLAIWKFRVGAAYHSVSNYTYLGPDCRPAQHGPNINILQLAWDQKFRAGIWNLDMNLVYQAASAPEAIHLPVFAGRASFYPTLALFKNAAILQPGIDIFYNTEYYSDGYMPALRSFYWQDGKKTGNYYYADVFINLMIKKFRIFIKYQHLNGLWSEARYYTVPHYPMQGPAFKWGLSWSFYD